MRSPLADDAAFEQPTVFLLGKPNTSAEKSLFDGIRAGLKGRAVAVKPLELSAGRRASLKLTEPGALALVLDRRGREAGRSAELPKVLEIVNRAEQVGRIDWAMEGTPTGDLAKRLTGAPSVEKLPGIMRAMSLNPEAMAGMIGMARKMHFADGVLPAKTHELIATYVSSLNQCTFCLTSHAGFLEKKGQDKKDVDAVALGDPSKAPGLLPKERALLGYIKKLTSEPWKIRDADVETLRAAGWADAEVYEATFIGSLFAFFNRMANAYGLPADPNGWHTPEAG